MATSADVRSKLRRQKSVMAHQERFDTIVKGSMDSLGSAFDSFLGDSIFEGDRGGQKDLAKEMLMVSFAHDLQRDVDRFVHNSVELSWKQYDTNQDGFLQKAELRELVNDLFSSIKVAIPVMVGAAIAPAADNLRNWVSSDSVGALGFHKGTGTDAAASFIPGAASTARMDAAALKLVNLLGMIMVGLIEKSQEISDELFDELDKNGDGKVSKAEFGSGFSESVAAILDFSRIGKQLLAERHQRDNMMRGLRRSSTFGGEELSPMNMVLGVGLGLALCGLFYQTATKHLYRHR